MKLGKKPARREAYKLRFADYVDTAAVLPRVPANFGHYPLISSYGVLGNDFVGDCVIAGGLHEVMIWNAEQARAVPVSDTCAIENYTAITGYDPAQTNAQGDNPTDQGTDVQAAAQYRIKHGLVDDAGVAHRVAAYVFVDPQNLAEVKTACYLFGAIGLGLDFPDSAMTQFKHGQVWRPVAGAHSLGGHYVTLAGWNHGAGVGITWGQRQLMTAAFIEEYADEAIAYLSLEMLDRQQKSPEGFDVAALRADLARLEAK